MTKKHVNRYKNLQKNIMANISKQSYNLGVRNSLCVCMCACVLCPV